MDRWSSDQLVHMEKGGNAKAREFFESKLGTGYKSMTIPEKVRGLSGRADDSIIRTLRWIIKIN